MKAITLKDFKRILIVGPAWSISRQLADLAARISGKEDKPQELCRTTIWGGEIEAREWKGTRKN